MDITLPLSHKKNRCNFFLLLLLLVIHFTAIGQDSTTVNNTSFIRSGLPTFDQEIIFPEFNYTAKVKVYLPAGYDKKNKRYPVLYLLNDRAVFNKLRMDSVKQDGRSNFDSLILLCNPYFIVAAINAVKENNFQEDTLLTSGDAANIIFNASIKNYLVFLAETLKPYIDDHYMTQSQKDNNMIVGADSGAIIAYAAWLLYPNSFGKAGIFSPVFSLIPDIFEQTDSLANKLSGKIFFYENNLTPFREDSTLNKITEILGNYSDAMIYLVKDKKSSSGSATPIKWLTEFSNWMRAEGFNYVITIKD